VPRGSSGGKRGKPSSTKLERASGPTVHPLYRALLAVGTKEKSIAPSAVRKYGALLNSEEVRRRAGPDADVDERARHASEALHAIVDGIAERIPRLVAQAALCTDQKYQGLRVTQRQAQLCALQESISEDMFKYHRRKVFESIVLNLETASVPSEAPVIAETPTTSLQSSSDADKNFTWLARAAAYLHYMMLTAIFIAEFEPKLRRREGHPYWGDAQVQMACEARTFESFVAFEFACRYLKDAQKACPLPSTDLRVLKLLIRTIKEYGPPFTSADRDVLAWGFDAEGKYREITLRAWEPWFFDGPFGALGNLPDIPTLEPIAAKTGAFALIISRHIALREPVFSDARRLAQKALAYDYSFDEFAPLFDGKSLRQLADTYFDRASATLAGSDLAWHDRKGNM
jgi:hypothetical protein